MAYTYISAQVRSRIDPSVFETIDVSQMPINDLLNDYANAYLTLLHTPTGNEVYVNLTEIAHMVAPSTVPRTLTDWLVENGNRTLPTVSTLPSTTARRVYYNEIFRAGYDVRPADINRNPDSQIPREDKQDILISKDDVDFIHHWRHCLATVNGMFHRVVGSEEGLYILDGHRSARIANRTNIGLMSFRETGPIRVIPISPDMVYKTDDQQQLRNYAYIRSPESLANKTVLLVLGGYLHALDGFYKQINDHVLRVDMQNLLLPERIYDSIHRIDLSSLQLEPSPRNENMYGVDDLYTDERLRAYLTLSQSFLVVMNTPDVYVKRHYLEPTQLPGRYVTSRQMKRYPLFATLGRCFDYSWFPKDDRMVLTTEHNQRFNYNLTTYPWRAAQNIDNTAYSFRPWEFADGYMLEIGRF